MSVPRLPEIVGGYRIERRISEGGMGEVVLARKEGTRGFEKRVAIKLLLPQFLGSDEVKELFFSEARLAARLSHPNVCQVYDFGEEADLYYIVMEYIDGVSVEQIMRFHHQRADRLPIALACRIVADAARGLHHAHTLRDDADQLLAVVHRDVSPQNLIVTYDGCTKILDFGIAKSRDKVVTTQQGIVRGKPGYMSPEQTRAEPLDARSDIFSLGTVLHELLSGEQLFIRGNIFATITAIASDPVPDLREVSGVPAELASIVELALDRNPAGRWESAAELARVLERVMTRNGLHATATELASYLELQHGRPALTTPPGMRASPEGEDLEQTTSYRGADPDGPTRKTLPSRSEDALYPEHLATVGAQRLEADVETLSLAGVSGRRRRALLAYLALLIVAAGLALLLRLDVVEGDPPGDREVAAVEPAPPVVDLAPGEGEAAPGVVSSPASAATAVENSLTGLLVVPARPRGRVFVDGVLIGRAPLEWPLAAGDHVVELRALRSSRVRGEQNVKIVSGETSHVRLGSPHPGRSSPSKIGAQNGSADPTGRAHGSISVRANPYANVVIDGSLVGSTPVEARLQAGDHEVVLIEPDTGVERYRRIVTIVAGETLPIRLQAP